MTVADLLPLMRDFESDRVERKESIGDPDKLRKAVCAFANDLAGHGQPGVIFVGLKDDGSCAGLRVTDDLQQKLAFIRDDGLIQPLPSIDVQRLVVDGCELAAVTVWPAVAPPVRYRGVVWVRVGSTTRLATPSDEARLSERRRFRDLPFDLHPISVSTIDDLERSYFERDYLPLAVAPDVLEENRRTLEDKLRALRFLSQDAHLTVVGALVAGRDPQQFLPGAAVQFLRIEGRELTDPIRDEKRLEGRLADVVRRTEEVIEAHNHVAVDFTGAPVEIRRWDYPLAALQQLFRNAVLHRSYESSNAPVRVYWFDDRIEILSPGGPFGHVTDRNFGEPHVSDYRNPHLAEAMRVLGFVQRFGVGIQIARAALRENGNPALEFDVQPTHVLVIVRRHQ